MPNINLLFDNGFMSTRKEVINQQYIDGLINGIDFAARLGKLSVMIIDFEEKKSIYVSPDMVFMEGIKRTGIDETGEWRYWEVMSDETKKTILSLRDNYLNFSKSISSEHVLLLDIPIEICSKEMYVHFAYKPILFMPDDQVKLGMCLMNCSVRNKPKCAVMENEGKWWIYNFKTGTFSENKYDNRLTSSEIEVLKIAEMGKRYKDIAGMRNVSVNTVKSHYKNIFKKLNVDTIPAAITCVYNGFYNWIK